MAVVDGRLRAYTPSGLSDDFVGLHWSQTDRSADWPGVRVPADPATTSACQRTSPSPGPLAHIRRDWRPVSRRCRIRSGLV